MNDNTLNQTDTEKTKQDNDTGASNLEASAGRQSPYLLTSTVAIGFFVICFFIILLIKLNSPDPESIQPLPDSGRSYHGVTMLLASDLKEENGIVDQLYGTNVELPSRFHLDEVITITNDEPYSTDDIDISAFFTVNRAIESNYELAYHEPLNLSEHYYDYMIPVLTDDDDVDSSEYTDSGDTDGSESVDSGDTDGSEYVDDGNEENTDSDVDASFYLPSEAFSIAESYGVPTEAQFPFSSEENEASYTTEELINTEKSILVTGTIAFQDITEIEDSTEREAWIRIIKTHIMKYGSIVTSRAENIVGWDDEEGVFITIDEENAESYYDYDSDELLYQIMGVLSVKPYSGEYSQYANSNTLFGYSGFSKDINNTTAVNYYVIKVQRRDTRLPEYLDHLVSGTSISYDDDFDTSIKVYLNPNSDSFNPEQLTLIGEIKQVSFTSSTSFISLDKPIELTGEAFALVFEFEEDEDKYTLIDATPCTINCMKDGSLYVLDDDYEIVSKAVFTFPVFVYTSVANDAENQATPNTTPLT